MESILRCFSDEIEEYLREGIISLFQKSLEDHSGEVLGETGEPISQFQIVKFVLDSFSKLELDFKVEFINNMTTTFIDKRIMTMNLDEAVNKNSTELVSFLLDSGKNPKNSLALINACKLNSVEIVKLLIERGCDTDNLEALKCSIENDCIEIAELLLDKDCNKYVRDIIHICRKDSKINQYLLRKYTDEYFRETVLTVE